MIIVLVINRSEGFNEYCQYGKEIGMNVLHAKELSIENKKIGSSCNTCRSHIRNLDQANFYLGYHYYLDGVVEKGFQLGRTIGFPTANIAITSGKIIPCRRSLCSTRLCRRQRVYRNA